MLIHTTFDINDINKFILLLRKCVYPHECMDDIFLTIASIFKIDQSKITSFAVIIVLLMVKKGIRCGICHVIHQYVKANNKCLKYHDKNKESIYLKYWNFNKFYGRTMSQKLHVDGFKWIENTSQFIIEN